MDGTYTGGLYLNDQNGWPIDNDGVQGSWHYRRFDLSAVVGKTVNSAYLVENGAAGDWSLKYRDFVLVSADGTVTKLYSKDTSISLEPIGSAGVTGRAYSIEHVTGIGSSADATTTFTHGDHLGSARMTSGYNGYPTWKNTYYPWGGGYNPQSTVTHYKFTGQERDGESGLDNFGARYYESSMGRFMTPDTLVDTMPIHKRSIGIHTSGTIRCATRIRRDTIYKRFARKRRTIKRHVAAAVVRSM